MQKVLQVLFTTLLSAGSAQAMDGLVARGAELTVTDLKTLLSIQASQEGSQQFQIEASDTERAQLEQIVEQIESDRARFVESEKKATETQIAQLRAERRSIQGSRLNADGSGDKKLQKKLFDNLLAEANLKSRLEKRVADFDSERAIKLQYAQADNMRLVKSIAIGGETVWNSLGQGQSAFAVAGSK